MPTIFDTKPVPDEQVQAPYIWAFRKFIRNPKNKFDGVKKWTTLPVLQTLWTLWDSPLKANYFFNQFRDAFEKRIEYLLGNSQNSRVNSEFLFERIKDFLRFHEIQTSDSTIIKDLVQFNSCSGRFTHRGGLSNLVDIEKCGEIILFQLELPTIVLGEETLLIQYLAIRTKNKFHSTFPAILFNFRSQTVRIGVYFSADGITYLNESLSSKYNEYRKYRFMGDEPTPPAYDPVLVCEMSYQEISLWHQTDKRKYKVDKLENSEANRFAEEYFHCFDYFDK